MDLPIKHILQILRQWCCPIIPVEISTESVFPTPPKREACHTVMTSAIQQQQSGIRYGLLDMSHLDAVVAFLQDEFFANEPSGVSLGLDREKEVRPWLRNLIQFQLTLQVSMGVWDTTTNELVGVSVNETDLAGTPHPVTLYQLVTPDFPNMYKITEIMQELHGDGDLFKMFDVTVFGHVSMLGVRSDYGGRGIATRLVELSEKVFMEKNIYNVYVETTSDFSAGAFRRMGYNVLAEVAYKDYKPNGEVVFKNTAVHTACRLFVKRLSGPH